MRSRHYEYDNHIEIRFNNEQEDLDILDVVNEALMGAARAAIETNDIYKALNALEALRDLKESVELMENQTDKEGEDE